jgi:pyruvate carboxylase subunit B
MLAIAEKLDKVGFFSLEVWGGATFDSCIRFLNEDPWERLRALRKKVPNTRLQMLLRGQNLVGYRHYADDVVREFIRLAVKNGMDVFRIFDALNDIRNMELAIKITKEYGGHVQGAICYTTSPVHTTERFAQMAEELEQLGCDSICIKDMAGLINPAVTTELVKAIKEKVSIPVDLHSHCTSGMAPVSYYAAVLAGADILDCAFSAFSWGTSQPPTESMVAAFMNTPYDTGLDLESLNEISEDFTDLSRKYRSLVAAEVTHPSVAVLLHQIPGGMISNLVSQLKEQNALDRLDDVLEEVPRVRADLGYPPLVTPTSQVVGTQAVFNVLAGERYKQVTQETKNLMLGYYGRPPGQINEEVRKTIAGDECLIDVRPADLIEPELEKVREEGSKLGIIHKEEDVITYALYPQVAIKFLRGEANEEVIRSPLESAVASLPVSSLPSDLNVNIGGQLYNIKISPVQEKPSEAKKARTFRRPPEGAILAPMAGTMMSIKVKVGDRVKKGDVVATIEAMKMQNEVHSPHNGLVKEILVGEGETVNSKDVIILLEADNKQGSGGESR